MVEPSGACRYLAIPSPTLNSKNVLGGATHMNADFSSAFCRHQQGQRPGPCANDQDIEIVRLSDFFLKIRQTDRPTRVGGGNQGGRQRTRNKTTMPRCVPPISTPGGMDFAQLG